MRRRFFLGMCPPALAVAGVQTPEAPTRPKVPGTLGLQARSRDKEPAGAREARVAERTLRWEVAQTAIIICDMWDTHTCLTAAQRVSMAPRMNQVVSAAPNLGVMIIHAPSDTMKLYEGRTRAAENAACAELRSAPTSVRQQCARHRTGGGAHRGPLVSLDPERRPHTSHSRNGRTTPALSS